MDTEGVYSILLPFIGTLSLNVKHYNQEVKGRVRRLYNDFILKVEKLISHENYERTGNSHKKIIGSNRLARRVIKDYHTEEDKSKRLLSRKKSWSIIEKYSNSKYKKRSKKLTRKKSEHIKSCSKNGC